MSKMGFIYHEMFLNHETGHSHPENRHRLDKIYSYVKDSRLGEIWEWIPAVMGKSEDLLRNHDESYIQYVINTCKNQDSALLDDGDTRVCEASYDVALLAVGAAIQAVDLIKQDHYKRLFVAARPPAHHALPDHAMGFCLFNHVAIATKYAMEVCGYEKIMILDWDVHHGNGTQASFYDSSKVLFCSIHQYPFYPGGGSSDERGLGMGENYTINIPLGEGSEMKQYREAMLNIVFPSAEAFEPDLLILSSGFDAHAQDPLANMDLRDEDFYELTQLSVEIAEKYCNGNLISFLEGGYNADALARSVVQHLTALSSSSDLLDDDL